MAKSSNVDAASLLAYLEHAIKSAGTDQAAFVEAVAKDVESAMTWRSARALDAVFTERHARSALEQLKLGRGLPSIYENLIDRLLMLAQDHGTSAETRAIAGLAAHLKEWLP